MSNIVSGEVTFEVLPANMWGFPSWMNNQHKEAANNSMKEQGRQGIYKGGMESYHHMCRFYSGSAYFYTGGLVPS
jgi:mannosyltransferase